MYLKFAADFACCLQIIITVTEIVYKSIKYSVWYGCTTILFTSIFEYM